MEPNVRSLPITIIDFLAILIPGFVWFILLITTFRVIHVYDVSPVAIYIELLNFVKMFDIWTPLLMILLSSLLIGNILKPMAMETAERILRLRLFEIMLTPFLKWYVDYERLNKLEKKLLKLRFPFDEFYEGMPYYEEVKIILKDEVYSASKSRKKHSSSSELEKKNSLNPDLMEFAGVKLFSAAKRYIRFISPTLWEESERMEAEVRMTGVLFLASVYSLLLSLLTGIIYIFNRGVLSDWIGGLFWFVVSVIAMIILAVGWTHLRHNEVSYTYMNVLIAHGAQK